MNKLEEIEKLKEICIRATKGPWKKQMLESDFYNIYSNASDEDLEKVQGRKRTHGNPDDYIVEDVRFEEDATFIEIFNPMKVLELLEFIENVIEKGRDE